jgi:hypothetical protein
MTRPQPKFHPRNRLGISGGMPPAPMRRPSSQEVMGQLKKNLNSSAADFLAGATAFEAGVSTPLATVLGTDPVLRGIAGAFDIQEIKDIQDYALKDPYGASHELHSAIGTGTGFSPAWKQAEMDARQEKNAGSRDAIKPKGAAFSKGLAGFKSPSFTRVMNQASEGPRTGLQSWAVW